MNLIPGVPKGANISVVDIKYTKSTKDNNTGRWSKPVLWVIYKHLDTGKVYKYEECYPSYVYYLVKDEDKIVSDRDLFTPIEYCEEIKVPYAKLLQDIAQRTGRINEFNSNKANGNYSANNLLHLDRRVRNSDMMLENNYMFRFDKYYKNDIYKPTVGFFDIETDNNYIPENTTVFPTNGNCPINLITYLNNETGVVNVYVLIDENNPSSLEFLEDFKKNGNHKFLEEFKEDVKNHVGDILYNKHLSDLTYKFTLFKEEIQLITSFFKDVHKDKLNFLLAWNIAFDLPFIIDRLKVLGVDPKVVICDPSFRNKICNYHLDEKVKDPRAKSDTYTISGYTVYMDQMVQYASRRKADTSIGSYKLDNIGNRVCKVQKLSWGHIARTFSDFIRKDFRTFVKYNIMDVFVQKCIEDDQNDVQFAVSTSITNCVVLDKIYKQTITLACRATKEFALDGLVIGNNHNGNTPKGKFPGAFVADGRLVNDFSKLKILGNPVRLYNNLDDYDFKSLYPNIIRQNNISFTTQVGRVVIDEPAYPNENPFDNDYFDRAGRFLEDYSVNNPINFGHRWLGLGSFEEVYDDVLKYMKRYGNDVDTTKNTLDLFLDSNDDYDLELFVPYKEYGISRPLFLKKFNVPKDIIEDVNNIDMSKIYDMESHGGAFDDIDEDEEDFEDYE